MSFIHESLTADGVSALGRIVAAKALLDIVSNDHIETVASIVAGGTGYAVGEEFDLTTGSGTAGVAVYAARGVVTAESAGVVTAARIISAGAYSTLPAGNISTANASLGGDDALTLTVTTQAAYWTVDRDTYTDDLTDLEWIATSTKSTNPATVGMETDQSAGNGYGRLLAATGFNGGSAFEGQPGASPVTITLVAFPATNPEIYVSTTERRVNFLIRSGNNVQLGVIGMFIPFTDTEANYPLPLAAFGQARAALPFSTAMTRSGANPNTGTASVVNAMPNTLNGSPNPYHYLDNLSAEWLSICELNGNGAEDARSQIWPQKQGYQDYSFTFAPQLSSGNTNPFTAGAFLSGILADNESSSDTGWFEGADGSAIGVQGVSALGPNARTSLIVQPHIISNQPSDVQIIGIIDGLQAVHGVGLTAFEDIVTAAGSRFLVFPDTNSPGLNRWVAMERV